MKSGDSHDNVSVMALFISDIDGTLLNPERTISPGTDLAIRRVIEAGHHFVLASSRPPRSMRILEAIYGGTGVPLAAYNGGLVLNSDGDAVLDVPVDAASAALIYEKCRELDLHCSFYSGDDWYAWADDHWSQRETNNTAISPNPEPASHYAETDLITEAPPHKIMCMGEPHLIDQIESLLESRKAVVTYRAKDTYLEIANSAVSKGDGAEMAANELGVDLGDVHFFGDNFNDLPAFAVAGTAIAVANARPEVLAAADITTASNHDDGVAEYLNHWMNENPRP